MIRDLFSISINFLYGEEIELDAFPKFSDLKFSSEDPPNTEDSAVLSQTIEEGDEETNRGDTEELGKLKKGEHLLAPMVKLGDRSQKKLNQVEELLRAPDYSLLPLKKKNPGGLSSL